MALQAKSKGESEPEALRAVTASTVPTGQQPDRQYTVVTRKILRLLASLLRVDAEVGP